MLRPRPLHARSVAILADAAHMLSDAAGFGISLFAAWAVTWRGHSAYSFGFHRAEIIGALLSTLVCCSSERTAASVYARRTRRVGVHAALLSTLVRVHATEHVVVCVCVCECVCATKQATLSK